MRGVRPERGSRASRSCSDLVDGRRPRARARRESTSSVSGRRYRSRDPMRASSADARCRSSRSCSRGGLRSSGSVRGRTRLARGRRCASADRALSASAPRASASAGGAVARPASRRSRVQLRRRGTRPRGDGRGDRGSRRVATSSGSDAQIGDERCPARATDGRLEVVEHDLTTLAIEVDGAPGRQEWEVGSRPGR